MRKRRTSTYKTRMFINIVIIALLPVLLVSTFSYIIFLRELKEKIEINNSTLAYQTVSQMDASFSTIQEYYSGVVMNKNMNWFFYSGEIQNPAQQQILDLVRDLKGPYAFTDYVKDYTVINYQADWTLGYGGMYAYSETRNKSEYEAFVRPYTQEAGRIKWVNGLNSIKTSRRNKTLGLYGYFLLVQIPPIGRTTNGMLLISVDIEKITSVLKGIGNDYSIAMIHKNGSVIYSNHDEFAAHCSANYSAAQQSGFGHYTAHLSQESFYTSYKASDTHDYILFLGGDQAVVKQSGNKILLLALIPLAAMGILLLVSRIGARKLYHPVSQLVEYVRSEVETNPEGKTEFEQLQKSVSYLVDNRNFLTTQIIRQKNMLEELFLLRMLRGYLTPAQIIETQEYLGLPQENYYALVAARLMPGEPNAEKDDFLSWERIHILLSEDHEVLKFANLYIPPSMQGEFIVFLLASPEASALEQSVGDLHSLLTDVAKKSFNALCVAGVSETISSLELLSRSFDQSREALKSSTFFEAQLSESVLTFFSDLINKTLPTAGYNLILEREVCVAVDLCDYDRALEAVKAFTSQLSAQDVVHHELQAWIFRFITAILRILNEAGISINQALGEEEGNLFSQISSLYNPKDLEKFINISIVIPTINALEEFRGHHAEDVYQEIIDLVKDKKGNITQTEAAEFLGYHPNYIWKVLKSEGKTTFSDFVAEEKLKLAEHLLLTTDKSISEISLELDYTNSQNFIRFFSRHKGVSPGRFRTQKKSDPDTGE